MAGRHTFTKQFKQRLLAEFGAHCAVCHASFEARYLQIDHSVPYSVAGDDLSEARELHDYMLLCGSCNRAKAWSCEHCPNQTTKSTEMCRSCYWASPQAYAHIATQPIRRLELIWFTEEIQQYDALLGLAEHHKMSLAEYIKYVLRNFPNQ